VTNAAGTCQFENIAPGSYNLTIKAQGFKTLVQNNIHLSAGEAHNAGRMLLELGAISQSVTVSASRSAGAQPDPFIKTLSPMTVLRQSAAPALAPVKQQAPALAGGPIRVGGNIQAAKIVSQIKPVYPQIALQQNVGGTVRIEAVVTKEGTLSSVNVVGSSDPLLTQSALDAVKQWRYQPTLLNGEPVEVLTTIDVNYEPGN
jgi:TonB family protein